MRFYMHVSYTPSGFPIRGCYDRGFASLHPRLLYLAPSGQMDPFLVPKFPPRFSFPTFQLGTHLFKSSALLPATLEPKPSDFVPKSGPRNLAIQTGVTLKRVPRLLYSTGRGKQSLSSKCIPKWKFGNEKSLRNAAVLGGPCSRVARTAKKEQCPPYATHTGLAQWGESRFPG
jgi:hypothetical protein